MGDRGGAGAQDCTRRGPCRRIFKIASAGATKTCEASTWQRHTDRVRHCARIKSNQTKRFAVQEPTGPVHENSCFVPLGLIWFGLIRCRVVWVPESACKKNIARFCRRDHIVGPVGWIPPNCVDKAHCHFSRTKRVVLRSQLLGGPHTLLLRSCPLCHHPATTPESSIILTAYAIGWHKSNETGSVYLHRDIILWVLVPFSHLPIRRRPLSKIDFSGETRKLGGRRD